jgi:hypothetical protein
MTTPDLAPLVAAAAQTIVQAMPTTSWPAIRDRFASLLAGRDEGAEQIRARTVAADLEAARTAVLGGQQAPEAQEARLRGDLVALLAARPDQEGPLGSAVDESRTLLTGGTTPSLPDLGTPQPAVSGLGMSSRKRTIAIVGVIALIAVIAAVLVCRANDSDASDAVRDYFNAADRGDADAMVALQCDQPDVRLRELVSAVRHGAWQVATQTWAVTDERALPGGDREVTVNVKTGTSDSDLAVSGNAYVRVVKEDGEWRPCSVSISPFGNER